MWSVPESTTDRTEWPESSPPPWRAEVRATLWWHRATDAARELGPGGALLPVTLAMMVDYLDSPVGPYREILASPVLRAPGRRTGPMPRMAVPFIAVDSEPSVHGGRVHWGLPKVLAAFDGDVHGVFEASSGAWRVSTTAHPRGPRLPIAGALGFAQPEESGERLLAASARLRGHLRYARVAVRAEGPTLADWLVPGTHHAVVITGRMTTGPAKLR
ncbi:acetoacetate decarboxylase family protein [Rhodococcus tibetensis]|uniref:Acetoacetate decarboxylase family protein n=1 Tax=Rhodococcus tibetensis TaxID=2965064 RepID=A0ABT1QHS4_9NOCA|nr:acetoacetate decarboxylase family protein [Rhodococcus sp. FXJ9.536]MCQ4121727.1 acetoacetate decarboxylase family protein [Rhodococcus sp. FXJ9.536]